MINIFNNEPSEYSHKAISILETIGNYYDTPTEAPIHAIITRLQERIDSKFLDRFPELQFILTATTGLDHINLVECQSRQIQIISLKGEYEFLASIAATAEHTMALMLSLLRNIPSAVEHVKKGHWNRMEHKGNELKGKTLCILGMGRLGIQIARMATAFQMNIKCFDNKNIQEYPCTTNLTKALHKSDILTIHLPYDPSTSGLIGEKQILEMNPESYIINTSRGQILNEQDVVSCLMSGHLAGVAVDVLEQEYDIQSSPLRSYIEDTSSRNVLITPHIGGCTHESMEATESFIATKFIKFLMRQQ